MKLYRRAGSLALALLSLVLLFSTGSLAGTEPAGPIANARYGHAAVVMADGRVLVAGGWQGSTAYATTSVEIFDPATGNFAAAAPMGTARAHPAATRLADGRILVAGGSPSNSSPPSDVASAEIFDPISGTWSATGAMATPRRGASAITLASGMVLIVGGESTSTCELYDPTTGSFTPTGSLNEARNKTFVVSALPDGRVLVAGGQTAALASLASAETWDASTGVWTPVAPMGFARSAATATPLPNGKVLVAGGLADSSTSSAVAVAELFDPAANAFSPTGSLAVARNGHAAALMGDGNAVIAGGTSGASLGIVASLEIYDVAAGTFRSGGSMANARKYPSATALSNGNVLLAAGFNSPMPTASELVNPACVTQLPSLSPSSASFGYGAATGTVMITQAPGCSWRALGGTSWFTYTSATQGTGSGSVSYSLTENTSTGGRGYTATIADNAFSVSQAGNACATASLSPTSQSFTSVGGTGAVSLSTLSTCNWTVTGAPSWVTITAGGSGSASISYTVAQNTGTARSATLAIAGKSFTISQAADACSPAPTISPASRSFAYGGGSSTVSVTAPSACSWTVVNKPAWITMSTSGTGSVTLSISAASNATTTDRSATFTVAGNSFTVTQSGNYCADATLSPTSASYANTANSGTVALTAQAACTWSVSGVPSWMTITAGASGSGSGTIAYSLVANSGASRSATLSIAGKSFTVSQAAGDCYPAPTLSSTSAAFTATAGNGSGSVSLTAGAACPWTISGVPAWMTLTSASSGTGNSVVGYTVAPNLGATRSAVLTIATRSYTVTQSAPGTATLPTGRMSVPRVNHTASALADGRVLVAGGHAGTGADADMTASVELYDPATGTFSMTAPLSQPRSYHAAARLADGRVLVVGGATYAAGTAQTLATAEIFDPAAGTWTAAGSLTSARRSAAAVTLADGRVLIVGGETGSGGTSLVASSEVFDPATGTFTPAGANVTPRYQPGIAALPDGRVLIVGGWSSATSYLATAELWNPATSAWTATGTMSAARGENPSVALLAGGQVLVAGGYTGSTHAITAETYDPATGSFTRSGNLNYGRRANNRAATLGDGSVVLVGGDSGGTVEKYIDASGTWQVVGQLSDNRTRGAVALAGNGRVLVTGGFPGPLSSAELFDASVCPATATLSPTSASVASASASGSISVTLTAGCPRTVSAGLPTWISITSGGSGSGSGTVGYSVQANNGAARAGSFSIAGATFTVSQAAGGLASCSLSGTISAGNAVTGTLQSGDCTAGARGTSYYTDRWAFDAAPGQQVAFQLSSTAFDTYLYLRDPNGTVIASNDDGGGGTNSRIPATSGVFTLPAGTAGTYVIEVTSYGTFSTGAYTLTRIQ